MSGLVGAALVKQIVGIEQTISQLCARAAGRLAEVETRQSGVALGALVAELYFLGDAWRRLGTAITAKGVLQDGHANCPDFPLLAECSGLLRALDAHLDQLSPEAALELQAAALDYRKYILRISSCDSADGIYELLSEFQGGSCFGLSESLISKVKPIPAPLSDVSSPNGSSGSAKSGITESRVLYWIDLLLSPELDREPEEYYLERITLLTFRSRHPQFSTAASQWPRHAEAFWPTLKPFLSSFFRIPGPYNWVHWVLEYARETWPDMFGATAFSRDALLDLTENLCDGSFVPLHFAAALGLPSLCGELVSMAKQTKQGIDQGGRYGTPFFCALVGPEVLKVGNRPQTWEDVLHIPEEPQNRAATISLFLKSGCDCKNKAFFWQKADGVSFLGLALWAALVTNDETILQRVVDKDAQMDENLLPLLHNTMLLEHGRKAGPLFVGLLAILFDQLLLRVVKGTTAVEGDLLETLDGVMTECDLKFSMLGRIKRVSNVTDSMFYELVHDVLFLDDTPHILRRLALDPRFDANQPWHEDSEASGTILHLAVSGDLLDVVEVLIDNGADMSALDAVGRTPLMLAETPEMLAKLLTVYGDTTTSTDYDGRNIWHYAGASNDATLLQWLCANDPWKEENLKAKTNAGCTPAAEAFLYIRETANEPKEDKNPEPETARLILKECLDHTYLQSSRPIAHVAAAWGREDLVETLVTLGVDFREIDENGRTAMHHLNSYASQALVQRFQELCEGLPIATDYDQTPAETMLTNIVLYETAMPIHKSMSAHPSCYRSLTDGFEQVLTSEVLAYKDFRGRGLWARFGEIVIKYDFEPLDMWFFRDSVRNAIRILASKGALRDYEETTGRSAAYALEDPNRVKDWPRWTCCDDVILHLTLVLSDDALTEKLYQSEDGIQLLVDAVERRCAGPMNLLSKRVPLSTPSERLGGRNMIEYVIEEALDVADVVIANATPAQLKPHKARLLEVTKGLPSDERADMLSLFRESGLEMSPEDVARLDGNVST